jgi:hypothetical protein
LNSPIKVPRAILHVEKSPSPLAVTESRIANSSGHVFKALSLVPRAKYRSLFPISTACPHSGGIVAHLSWHVSHTYSLSWKSRFWVFRSRKKSYLHWAIIISDLYSRDIQKRMIVFQFLILNSELVKDYFLWWCHRILLRCARILKLEILFFDVSPCIFKWENF